MKLTIGDTGLFSSKLFSTKGTHSGKRFCVILDECKDYYLIFTFSSSTPMSFHFPGEGWEGQEIFPKGIGGKDMDSYGSPNLTHWIHKSSLKSCKKGEFSDDWMDLCYEELEKFYGKSFEDITFKIDELLKR